MNLQHSYAELDGPFTEAAPTPGFDAPTLIAWNAELAGQLGLGDLGENPDQLARWFSGTEPLPEARPVAQAYAGHQFGQFVPQLGDGRAALLGEAVDDGGKRWDIQLKGSGRTAFSRGGDGKSSLGPVIREYLVSEAMHALGVPTTRALAAVATGESVFRNQVEAGGVFTRVASSHLRIGTFQYFAARGNKDALKTLADYAIGRHEPGADESKQPYLRLFEGVVERQSRLVAHWLSFGFIHGVMNTDNTSISGETIDYGPCAFMDEFRHDKVFSSIDQHGRYAFANQAKIVHWNLARLAECLLMLDENLEGFQAALDRSPEILTEDYLQRFGRKLGIQDPVTEDRALIDDFLEFLEDEGRDFSISFRELSDRIETDDKSAFGEFETRWRSRLTEQGIPAAGTRALMNSVNPAFIPRNHQVERAIAGAFEGNYEVFNELRAVLARPFDEQPGAGAYALAPEPAERVTRTFCGT
ncbi:MAG: YdiU family protein [Pseudomonadota bacterium]